MLQDFIWENILYHFKSHIYILFPDYSLAFKIIKSQKPEIEWLQIGVIGMNLRQAFTTSHWIIKFGLTGFHSSKVVPRINTFEFYERKCIMENSKLVSFQIFKHLIFLKMLNKSISYDT